MSIRKISLLTIICLLSTLCSAQRPIYKPRPVTRTATFKNPVRSTSFRSRVLRFKRNSGFLRGPRLEKLVLNYRNEHFIKTLAERLKPFTKNEKTTFSGHFVTSTKALERTAQAYTKEEFRVDPEHAIQDMLAHAVHQGFGVVKVYEAPELPGLEPKMTVLVLNLSAMDWMVYRSKAAKGENVAEQIDPTKPTVILGEDGTFVLIHKPKDLENLRRAYGYYNTKGEWVERQQPFYVELVANGDPLPSTYKGFQKVYNNYTLAFSAYEGAPLFLTIEEVEAWIKDKGNMQPSEWVVKAREQSLKDRERDYPALGSWEIEKFNLLNLPDITPVFKKTTALQSDAEPAVTNPSPNIHVTDPAKATGFPNPGTLYGNPRTGASYHVLENVHRPVPPEN